MLEKTFEGLTEAEADHRFGHLMSPRQHATHLSEAYVAAVKHAKGEKHDWGSYQPAGSTWDAVLQDWRTRRAEAVEALLGAGDDESLKSASDYIVGHDHYHVGQMCSVRLNLNPQWNAYSIYGG